MRIDYSEPKKSCSSPQLSQNRPRKESAGGGLVVVVFTGVICLGIGFSGGWMVSQKSAKKAFRAAMEQQSLENSPKQPLQNANMAAQQSAAAPGNATPLQQSATTGAGPQQPATGAGIPTPNEAPLSFYKTLPSGQKSTVLGSGINTKEDKPAKQPLQAAMPTNLAKPATGQNDENVQKPVTPATPPKTQPNGKQDQTGFTVQVASYSLKSEAETLRSSLAGKGYNVSIVESHLGDKGTWYRVRVGKRLDTDAAKELAKKLGKGAISIPDKE